MFTIDYKSRVPLYQQIVDNVEKLALRGILLPEQQLPSVRALAMELSINPNTIAKAYAELESRGIIYSLSGRGSFVSGDALHLRESAQVQLSDSIHSLQQEALSMGFSDEELEALWQSSREDRREQHRKEGGA